LIITAKVQSSIAASDETSYSVQCYGIQVVSVKMFRFPPTQTGRNAITDIILKEALKINNTTYLS
jgi:hypothetical protein